MKKKLIFFLFSILLYADELQLYFDGNKNISTKELYTSLGLYEPQFYEFYLDKPKIKDAQADFFLDILKSYYKSKGFYHITIDYTKDTDSIIYKIQENNPIIVDNINIVSSLDISNLIEINKGDIFDSEKFTTSKNNIKLLYAKNGFCNIALDAKAYLDIELDKAYLIYTVEPKSLCHINKIDIQPTANIENRIIKSLLYIKEGDELDTNKINLSYESLYGYEGISKAIIETNPDENSSVGVNVKVFENEKPIRFQSGLAYTSDEGAMVLLGVKHSNLFNNLKTLGVESRLSQIKQTVKTNYDMPLFHRNFTGIEVGYQNEKFVNFKEDKVYSSIYLMQKNSPHTVKESIVFDKSREYDMDKNGLYAIDDNHIFVISPKLEYSYDVRDNRFDPRSGYFLNAMIMSSIKSGFSDATYYKFVVDGGFIVSYKESVLALKSKFGTIVIEDGNIPSSYKYFAGGMYSNRGYAYKKLGNSDEYNNPIGSNSIFETTLEARFDIYKDFRGVLFSDNTFLGNGSTPKYDNGYYSVGAGIRYKTPIGLIALDVGCDVADPTKQYAIHFHIGELF